jgi:hypothetical protein
MPHRHPCAGSKIGKAKTQALSRRFQLFADGVKPELVFTR